MLNLGMLWYVHWYISNDSEKEVFSKSRYIFCLFAKVVFS